MEGENSSSSGQHASRGRRQGGPDRNHCDCVARCRAGGVYSRSASPIEDACDNTPILAPSHNPLTTLIPLEEVVIEPRCSPGSPGVEFIEGSSEGKVEGTPEYVPTSPSVDWNAIADEMAVDPYDRDSLDEDTLEDLTMSWRHGIGWSEERAAHRGSGWG
jgi:hypothetical protein